MIENVGRICGAVNTEGVFNMEECEAAIQSEIADGRKALKRKGLRREDNKRMVPAERLRDVKINVIESDEGLNSMLQGLDM